MTKDPRHGLVANNDPKDPLTFYRKCKIQNLMAIPNAKKKILKAEKGIFKKSFATSDERESKQQEASIEIY